MINLKVGSPIRVFLLVAGSMIWLGIWLTRFNVVHWFMYVPATFFVLAAITGLCPGIGIMNALFGKRES
ncbi:MAG: hypothetical protein V3V50_04255 [Gammaproteobacteria bacterium]